MMGATHEKGAGMWTSITALVVRKSRTEAGGGPTDNNGVA